MLDWFHIGMRLQHLKQIAGALSADHPARVAAKGGDCRGSRAAAPAHLKRQAKNARKSIDRIRAVMSLLEGETAERKSVAPYTQAVDRLARARWLSVGPERLAGEVTPNAIARACVSHCAHRRDVQFPGEPPDE
jgi:hypothetical protein